MWGDTVKSVLKKLAMYQFATWLKQIGTLPVGGPLLDQLATLRPLQTESGRAEQLAYTANIQTAGVRARALLTDCSNYGAITSRPLSVYGVL